MPHGVAVRGIRSFSCETGHIRRLSAKYTGRPYPRDEERVVFLVDVEHSATMKFG
jgi:hypothetical protein